MVRERLRRMGLLGLDSHTELKVGAMRKAFALFLVVLCFSFLSIRQTAHADAGPESAAAQPAPVPIAFEDPNLEAAVRKAIRKQSGELTDMDAMSIESLYAPKCSISRLGGIEYLTGLQRLDLSSNSISNISPLAGLTALRSVSLNDNEISDITPLAGLAQVTEIRLVRNRIFDISPLARLAGLEHLSLAGNWVSDISPLTGLTKIHSLALDDNLISDISPLATNTCLRKGCTIWLEANRLDLSPESDNTRDIDTLTMRGATVYHRHQYRSRPAGVETSSTVEASPRAGSSVEVAALAKTYASSEHFRGDYVELLITDEGKIRIVGRSCADAAYFGLMNRYTVSNVWTGAIGADGAFSGVYDATRLKDDVFTDLSFSLTQKNGTTQFGAISLRLGYEDGGLCFIPSPVYEHNLASFRADTKSPPDFYLSVDILDSAEREAIMALAADIVVGITDEYEKLLRVHDWVAENIYYHYDAYLAGESVATSAYATLTNRMSVCQGYATLTEALLRSIGIPARVVGGFAFGGSNSGKYWDEVDHSRTNHAWNEAFVDGRWVIVDTTWDTSNRYRDGQFRKGSTRYAYFDPSLQAFSETHKIMRR